MSTLGETLSQVSARRGTEPARLSALVRGDLNWIVMKALEKDRRRRYETASGLAADVRRFLAEDPVEARPASAWYRFGKLARRHKAALTTTAIVANALVLGTVLSTWQAFRATQAERIALNAEQRAFAERDAAAARRREAEAARENLRRTLYDADAASGAKVASLAFPEGEAMKSSLSADGSRLAISVQTPNDKISSKHEHLLIVVETATGRRLVSGKRLENSPDGARIAASLRNNLSVGPGKPEVGLWDAVTGRQVLVLKGPTSYVYAIPTSHGIAFSSDGQRILSAVQRYPRGIDTAEESEVKVWDATPWTENP